MNERQPLPTFFVIGAPKCGTTSLHHYLDAHPEISMTSIKEPQIFSRPDYRDLLHHYGSLFDPTAPVRGESSAVYSQYPRWDGVPERIQAAVPDARLVYIVGDPVDRIVAHYGQHVTDGKEERPLETALDDFRREDSQYVCPSRYATQVRRYLDWFPAERILVLDQADLLSRRAETMRRVFRFLGVREEIEGAFSERLNTRAHHRRPTVLGARLRGTKALELARRLPLPTRVRQGLRGLASREVERPRLSPARRYELAASLRAEVDWLRSFSGEPFASWRV